MERFMYSASFTNFWYHIRLDYTGLLIQAWSTTLQYWVKIFHNFHARASKCWKWNWKRRSLGGGDMLLAGEFSVTCNTVVKALSFSSISTLVFSAVSSLSVTHLERVDRFIPIYLNTLSGDTKAWEVVQDWSAIEQ